MILICYDGSTDAKSAIEHAGQLMKDHAATVLTVWQPFAEVMRQTGAFGLGSGAVPDVEEIDNRSRSAALALAEEGAKLAVDAGLGADALTVAQETTIAEAILSEARRLDASAIVTGTRGLTGVKSLLLGSVSHAVIQHADRAVVVVPSADVAAARGRQRDATIGS